MIVCVQYYHWTVIPSNVPTRPSTCTHGRKRLKVFVCLGCACLASPTQWGVMICESPSARNNPQWQCLSYNRLQMFAHSTVHTKTNNMALTKPYKRWGVYSSHFIFQVLLCYCDCHPQGGAIMLPVYKRLSGLRLTLIWPNTCKKTSD